MASLAIPLITAGISGLAGLFGNKPKTTTTDSTFNNSSNPNFSPLQQTLMNLFSQKAIEGANTDTDLSGYTAQGLRQINQGGDAAQKTASNYLASRGLSNSPYAAVLNNQNNLARTGQQANFLNGIPMLSDQLRQQHLQQLVGAFSSIPTGQTQSGTGTQTSTATQPGGGFGGFISGLGSALLAPQSSVQNNNLSTIANAFGQPRNPAPNIPYGSWQGPVQ